MDSLRMLTELLVLAGFGCSMISAKVSLIPAAGAVDAVLSNAFIPHCSIILLTDGTIATTTVFTILAHLRHSLGVGVFHVVGQEANTTQAQLSLLVDKARRMRQLSWCVTVVVVSDDPAFLAAFAQWSLKGRLLVWSTRLHVVTRLPISNIRVLVNSYWTFSMMNTLVLLLQHTSQYSRCDVYVHLPYSPQGAQVLRVASWTAIQGLTLTTHLPLFPEKFYNFYGATINVTAKPYKPVWYIVEETAPDGSIVKRRTGMDYLMLEAIAEALNFTFDVLPIKSWAEGLERVIERVSFITPAYHAVLYERLERFDFTTGFTYIIISFSMAKPELTPNWLSLYNPLTEEVWASILGVLLLVPSFLFMMVRMTHLETCGSVEHKVGPGYVYHTMLGVLLGQNLSRWLPSRSSSRVLVAAWLVFAFIIGTVYRGNLTAALTLPKYPSRPETLEELVNSANKYCIQRFYLVTMEPWGKDYKTSFKNSGSRVIEKLADLMHVGPLTKDGLQDALVKKQAHLEIRHVMQVAIAGHFTRADGSTPLYIGREFALNTLAAWPIPHDAPFQPSLDRCISSITEAGLYEKWTEDVMNQARQESRAQQRHKEEEMEEEEEEEEEEEGQSSSRIKALTLTHMLGPFVLLALGLILAGNVFVIEKGLSNL